MPLLFRNLLLASAAVCVATVNSTVMAQDEQCENLGLDQGPQELSPAAGARDVALGAPIGVRYSRRPDEMDTIEVQRCEDEGCEATVPVAGEVQRIGEQMFFVPSDPWLEGARYTGIVGGRDGDLSIDFTTGSTFDQFAPSFGEIEDVSVRPSNDPCSSDTEGYRVEVQFARAFDDGSQSEIEYLLFLTRGDNVEAPRLVARTRNFAASSITMAFFLAREDSGGPICIAAVARDGVGRVDDDGQIVCLEPATGSFFEPACSLVERAPVSSLLFAFFLLLFGARIRRLGIRPDGPLQRSPKAQYSIFFRRLGGAPRAAYRCTWSDRRWTDRRARARRRGDRLALLAALRLAKCFRGYP